MKRGSALHFVFIRRYSEISDEIAKYAAIKRACSAYFDRNLIKECDVALDRCWTAMDKFELLW